MISLRQKCLKKLRVPVSEIKRVEKITLTLKKLAHVTQHCLQEYIVKNIEVESTKANDLSHIL